MKLFPLIGLTVTGVFTLSSQAALLDRGNGLIYSTAQNITWLQDANYAKTSGYDADGRMNWNTANAWAGQLTYGGYDDWRLATITDTGTPGCYYAYSGSDCGYNVDASTSELAYMYDYLGNTPYFDISGNATGPLGLQSNTADGITFANLQSSLYWLGTEYALNSNDAWTFNTSFGNQFSNHKYQEYYAWAVRPGDVAAPAPVPLPGAIWLFGAGLAGLICLKQRPL